MSEEALSNETVMEHPAQEPVRRTQIPFLKRWTSFGSGTGIAIGPDNLQVALVEVRPQGIRVVDAIEILRYRERPAAEWGAEYDTFLRKHKWTHVAAYAVLPAREVMARTLALPGVQDQELAAAVAYQLDGLHPYEEDQAEHSFARLQAPNQTFVTVNIARRDIINEYATLFEEAGVPVAGFTSPAAAYYSALRVLQLPPEDQFLLTAESETDLEIYAETPSHPLYCVTFPVQHPRALEAASSQVRLADEAPRGRIASFLPVAESTVPYSPLAFAGALVSALPKQALRVNLLPAGRRRESSRWKWVPTLVLIAFLAAAALALHFFQEFENRRLIAALEQEAVQYTPRLNRLRQVEARLKSVQGQLDDLQSFLRQPQQDLDALRELTRRIPPQAWVSRLDLLADRAVITGEIDQATDLLRILDESPLFAETQFTAQPGRTADGREIFQLRTNREKPKEEAPAATVPGPPAPPTGEAKR
jgi:Tfp pilus assembly protein PilN